MFYNLIKVSKKTINHKRQINESRKQWNNAGAASRKCIKSVKYRFMKIVWRRTFRISNGPESAVISAWTRTGSTSRTCRSWSICTIRTWIGSKSISIWTTGSTFASGSPMIWTKVSSTFCTSSWTTSECCGTPTATRNCNRKPSQFSPGKRCNYNRIGFFLVCWRTSCVSADCLRTWWSRYTTTNRGWYWWRTGRVRFILVRLRINQIIWCQSKRWICIAHGGTKWSSIYWRVSMVVL